MTCQDVYKEEGKEEGRVEGRVEGAEHKSLQIVTNILQQQFDLKQIVSITGFLLAR